MLYIKRTCWIKRDAQTWECVREKIKSWTSKIYSYLFYIAEFYVNLKKLSYFFKAQCWWTCSLSIAVIIFSSVFFTNLILMSWMTSSFFPSIILCHSYLILPFSCLAFSTAAQWNAMLKYWWFFIVLNIKLKSNRVLSFFFLQFSFKHWCRVLD